MRRTAFILIACWVSWLPVRSQLCSGSLGDPVVHFTFGSGSTANPLPGSITTYNYKSGDCPEDGWYTIANSTNACFGNSWHTVSEDHTPADQNGYMMVINASFQAGVFYVDTVRGLCSNTTYEFAAWMMNLLRPGFCGGGIDPNLTFNIEATDGAVLATYQTGNITESSSPTWKQYGTFFKTTANSTSVVIRLTNNAPGGCGNDLLLDDITFRPCGPKVTASLSVNGDTTLEICEDNPAAFLLGSDYSDGYSDPVFQWQVSVNDGSYTDIPGAGASTWLRNATAPGKYRYRLSITERNNVAMTDCRVASNTVLISVNALPQPSLADQTTGCDGLPLTLEAKDGATYNWTGPNGFTAPEAAPVLTGLPAGDAGMYYVTVTSNKGCVNKDSTNVIVYPGVSALINGELSACEGTPVQLQASGGIRYAWTPSEGLSSPADPEPIAMPADTTQYTVTVYNEYNCFDTATVLVNVWKKPKAVAGPDKTMREGEGVLLEGAAAGTNVSFFWSPPAYLNNPANLTPAASPANDMTYTLNVVSDFGCGSSSDQVFVRVYKDVSAPNAFSPNGDGVNDTWIIKNLHTYPEAVLQVFNRHGQPVYQSRGYSKPWDGTFKGQPLPVGTYYYVIDLKAAIFPRMSGWVFIVR